MIMVHSEPIKRKKKKDQRSPHFKLIKSHPSFFEKKYVLCMFIVLLLSLMDGTTTIFLLSLGAWEANPVMGYALSMGHEFFFFVKYFLTAGGLLFLLGNGDRRVFGGLFALEEIAGGLVLFYLGLVIYELAVFHIIQ
jgi:hypothetical protein